MSSYTGSLAPVTLLWKGFAPRSCCPLCLGSRMNTQGAELPLADPQIYNLKWSHLSWTADLWAWKEMPIFICDCVLCWLILQWNWATYLDSEFEQVLGVDDRHRCLECCSPWARKESDTTDRLNWTDALFIKTCFWPAWGDVFHKVPFCLNVRNEWLDLSNRSYYYLTMSNGWTEIVAVASLSSSKLWSTS